MKRLIVLSLACLVVVVIASSAFTQEAKPCAGDIAKFCGIISSQVMDVRRDV
ncbi:MAG: hypothetical protein ACLPX5_15950 [Dissulfurispiraceae bacterium]